MEIFWEIWWHIGYGNFEGMFHSHFEKKCFGGIHGYLSANNTLATGMKGGRGNFPYDEKRKSLESDRPRRQRKESRESGRMWKNLEE